MRAVPRAKHLLVALLVAAQGVALAVQVADGFVPFGPPPGRVPLSWDMFATSVERCDVTWTPPLEGPRGGELASLADLAPRLEWNLVLPAADDFEQLGTRICQLRPRAPGTRMHLTCFFMDGRREERDDACPGE